MTLQKTPTNIVNDDIKKLKKLNRECLSIILHVS